MEIASKNTFPNKVQFTVNLSPQKSDLWTEGTSDRRRKWSFRIEATEARRGVGAMNLEESQRCWHTSPLFSGSRKSIGRICCRPLNLEESPKGWHRYFLKVMSDKTQFSWVLIWTIARRGSYFMLKTPILIIMCHWVFGNTSFLTFILQKDKVLAFWVTDLNHLQTLASAMEQIVLNELNSPQDGVIYFGSVQVLSGYLFRLRRAAAAAA